jgi:hypothetical protein
MSRLALRFLALTFTLTLTLTLTACLGSEDDGGGTDDADGGTTSGAGGGGIGIDGAGGGTGGGAGGGSGGDGSGGGDPARSDAGPSGPDDAAVPGPDAGAGPTDDIRVIVDPDRRTQIHAHAVADGRGGVWLAYNGVEEGTSVFDTFLVHITGVGAVDIGPVRVSDEDGVNDIEPVVALLDDRVVVLWQADTTELQPDNLDILFRAFDLEGNPLGASRDIEPLVDGEPFTRSWWMPAVATFSDGTLALVGARADTNGFAITVQLLDEDGTPAGPAWTMPRPEGESHVFPTAAVRDDILHIAWRADTADAEFVRTYALTREGAPASAAEPEIAWPDGPSNAPAFIPGADWLAMGVAIGGDPSVRISNHIDGGGRAAIVGAPNRVDHTPWVAGTAAGGVLAHYSVVRGIQNDLWWVPFEDTGDALVTADPIQAPSDGPVAPYTPCIVRVGNNRYFAAWSQGNSPEFLMIGHLFTP